MTMSTIFQLGLGLFVILYVKAVLFRKSSIVEKQVAQLINEWFGVNVRVKIQGIASSRGNDKSLHGAYTPFTRTVYLNTRSRHAGDIESLACTIAHEGRHAWQYANNFAFSPKHVPYKQKNEEIDAFAYGDANKAAMLEELIRRGLVDALLKEMKKRR